MSPIAAGLLLDACALICLTLLTISGKVDAAKVLPIVSMILAARFAPAARAALATAGGEGRGSAPPAAPPPPGSSPPPPLARLAFAERRAPSLARQLLQASGVVVVLCMIPLVLVLLVKRHALGLSTLAAFLLASSRTLLLGLVVSVLGAGVTITGALVWIAWGDVSRDASASVAIRGAPPLERAKDGGAP